MKKKIIIGVSGGIASYKSADLASKLVQYGMDVNVCMDVYVCVDVCVCVCMYVCMNVLMNDRMYV